MSVHLIVSMIWHYKSKVGNLTSVIASIKCRGQMFPIDTEINGKLLQRHPGCVWLPWVMLWWSWCCLLHCPPSFCTKIELVENVLKSELLWFPMWRRAVCQNQPHVLLTLSLNVIKDACSTCKTLLQLKVDGKEQLYCIAGARLWEVMSPDIETNLYLSCHQNITWALGSKVLISTFGGKSNKIQTEN